MRPENGDELTEIKPFEYRGHMISGRVSSSGVSSGGTARVSNATWLLTVDGGDVATVCEAQWDDDEGRIKPMLEAAADNYIHAPRCYGPGDQAGLRWL